MKVNTTYALLHKYRENKHICLHEAKRPTTQILQIVKWTNEPIEAYIGKYLLRLATDFHTCK